ncbi:MAG: hypothetical protein RBU37_28400 [Myxococcota bacterium]|nr:hypothetical protein [Myxococcota bacterium]
MSTSELSSLYRNKPLLLLVEDSLTWTYLRSLWEDDDIGFLVAGGNQILRAAVKDAREGGHPNVFGLQDRDFGASNHASWLNPNKNPLVFVPKAFEIENYLLDFDGLGALGPGHNPWPRQPNDLRTRANQLAGRSLWWMAVRATIAEVHEVLMGSFPAHPPMPNSEELTNLDEARALLEEKLLGSAWGQQLAQWVPGLNRSWVEARLLAHQTTLEGQRESSAWVTAWSGKELFNHLAGYMRKERAPTLEDLAKGLAEYQRSQHTEPPELLELRSALRKRVGLEPW